MPTQCNRDLFGYEVVEGRQVVAAFDGGDNTSDAGGLLLGATKSRDQSGRAADAAPDTVGNDRAEAALRRVTAPCRDAAWRSDGLSRLIHAARFEVCCERAARVLGYGPRCRDRCHRGRDRGGAGGGRLAAAASG
jgi:hypothetical protein